MAKPAPSLFTSLGLTKGMWKGREKSQYCLLVVKARRAENRQLRQHRAGDKWMSSKRQKSHPKWNVNKLIDHSVTPYFPTQWLSHWMLQKPTINHLTFTGALKAARLMCWNAIGRKETVHGGPSLTHTERQPSLSLYYLRTSATWSSILPRQLFSGGTATFPTLLLTCELRWERFPKIHMWAEENSACSWIRYIYKHTGKYIWMYIGIHT